MSPIRTWCPPDPQEPRAVRRARQIRELASLAPGGVLFTARAREAGWPAHPLYRRLRAAGWQPIHPGAWAAPGRLVDWLTHAWVVQSLQPHLVCSHRTAAALHLVEVLDPSRTCHATEFTDPRPGAYRRRPGTRVHRLPLDAADRTVRRGLITTSAARTVGDLIRRLPRNEAVAAADSALATRTVRGVQRPPLVHMAALRAELATHRRGAVRARTWLPLTDARSGSPAETVARLHLHDAGLHPETQAALRKPSGRTLHPDFFFRSHGLVVEVEGYAFHGTREAHAVDLRRFNELQACPEVRRVLRFTAAEVFRHPDRVVAQIRAALAALHP
ncbi:endonuclease domain-containing protein [Streptomyces sp. NPDC056452]|uniref:endonuclease domain-containing protein n=1 Tax=Streptomyces sp. NPDC056452 TaxID=3345821 RepID=UPI0036CC54F7